MSLFGPRYRDDDPKFRTLKDFDEEVKKLLFSDHYVSKKEYTHLVNKTKDAFTTLKVLQDNQSLLHWCKTTKSNPKALDSFLLAYSHVEESIQQHNNAFLRKHLTSDKTYLDTILEADNPGILLDEDQRKVVLSDEDYTLVIAGAGAGKTTTLEAKAKYLVERKGIDPKRILVVSFTKKATRELQERFQKIGVEAKISTFHSIGNAIIHSNEGRKSIKGPGFLFDTLRNYLISRLEDEGFIKKITLFFASYLDMPFDSEKSIELYKRTLADSDFTTLKSELDDFKDQLTKKKVTIRSERVRSIQECQIANFLYINGIDYEYEPLYPFCIPGTQKPYTPDFKLTQGDKVVYLEHYGIHENGTSWRFSHEELEEYQKHICDKERFHKIHKTKLIHTYSGYNDGRDLIHHLSELLRENGFTLHQREPKTIYKEIAERAEDRYFAKLIQLLCNFINRFKTNHYPLERFSDFQAVARENKDERTLLFLDIARQCYVHYDAALKQADAIDFEDMINNAADILDEKIQRGEKLPFDYVFIDEYQDISFQRFNLAEKLSHCSDAKIVAVGDDWQSIFRFSGADITLFTDFEKRMGYGQILYLRNTHRNSQELIDLAGKFVMKNDLQKKKTLQSPKHIEDPVVVVSYDDTYASRKEIAANPQNSPYYRMGKAMEKALEDIRGKFGEEANVLLLGRYNFDGRNLNKLSDLFFCTSDNRVKSKAFPKMKIHFMTAHSSKGLGADNVILVNGKDDVLGFPSKIEDDPVMKLVLKEAKEIDYAEERRLFYVALTRTKNRVYLITPKSKPSSFVTELMNNHTNIVLNGPHLDVHSETDYRYRCPRCGYPLQIRKKRYPKSKKELALYLCSNDPEVCGFLTNDVTGGRMSIQKCPDCEDGYLIVKRIKKDGADTGKRILGCTNYKSDGTGCNYVIRPEGYKEMWERMSRTGPNYSQNGKKLPIEDCVLAGFPIMDLLKIFRYVVGSLSQAAHYSFIPYSLNRFLIGERTDILVRHHLDENKAFGCIAKEHQKLVFALMDVLVDYGFLLKTGDTYPHLSYSGKEITEDFARMVFERFVSTR